MALVVKSCVSVASRRSIYLWILLAQPILVAAANYFFPTSTILGSQRWPVVLGLIILCSAIAFWLPFKSQKTYSNLQIITWLLIVALWIWQTVLMQVQSEPFLLLIFMLPLSSCMILLKPASKADIQIGVLVVAYAFMLAGLGALLGEAAGSSPPSFLAERNGFNRIPYLQDFPQLEGRWEGSFGASNLAGPVGGFLLLASLFIRRPHSWMSAATGALFLLLSQSRSALMTLGISALIVLLVRPPTKGPLQRLSTRLSIVFASLLLAFLYISVFDPTFGLRTVIWGDFIRLWHTSPLFGVSTQGIQDYVTLNQFATPPPKDHAHSVFLDVLTRYGLIPLLLLLTICSLLIILGWRSSRLGDSSGLAFAVFGITSGLVETTYSWTTLNFLTLPLLLSLLLSTCVERKDKPVVLANGASPLWGR